MLNRIQDRKYITIETEQKHKMMINELKNGN